jgi:hypothetical protein
MAFQLEIPAKNAFFALFSPKIQTWTTMPLKVGFFPGFRGLLTDCSLRRNGKKSTEDRYCPIAKCLAQASTGRAKNDIRRAKTQPAAKKQLNEKFFSFSCRCF